MAGEQGTLTWGWTHDKNGRVKTATDPKGQVLTSTWGVLGSLTRQDYTNHAAPRELPSIDSIEYQYDGNGNPTRITETKQTTGGVVAEETTRAFHGLDRLESETGYDGKTVSYTYDLVGKRMSVTDPYGAATSYTYDGQNWLTTVTTPAGLNTYH